jgi:hypothetical protein
LFTLLDKYVARDGFPGIVHANKEGVAASQRQRRTELGAYGSEPRMPIQPALHTPQMEAEHETLNRREPIRVPDQNSTRRVADILALEGYDG